MTTFYYAARQRTGMCRLLRRNAALQFFRPIDDDIDLSRGLFGTGGLDFQQSSFRRNIVSGDIVGAGLVLSGEQKLRSACSECRLGANLHRHRFVSVYIKQFAAISRPNWLISAGRRNLNLSACILKWPHINLRAARFCGLVCDPMSVWRKMRVGGAALEELGFSISFNWEHPDAASSGWIVFHER